MTTSTTRRLARHALGSHPIVTVLAAVATVGACSLAGGVAILLLSGHAGHEGHASEIVGAGAEVLAAIAATSVVVTVARSGRGARQFVRGLALALALATAGATAWLVERLRSSGPDPAGPHELLYLAAALVAIAAAASHPSLGTRRRRTRTLVDAMISGLAAVVVLWLLGGRALAAYSGQPVESFAAVLVVASGLVVTRMGLSVMLAREKESTAESAAALVTIGFFFIATGGILHLVAEGHAGVPWVAAISDAAMVAGFATIAVAGMLMLRVPREFPLPIARRQIGSVLAHTPIVTAVAATLAVLVDAALTGQFDATASGVMTIAICTVLLRQSLTLSDNRELSASLRTTVEGLEQQATHDALTGLPNRYGLPDRLGVATRRAAVDGTLCAVYFVDVDRLKAVNDMLGHRAGDLLIRATGDRLSARVGPRVTRFGGDEFVLVVEDTRSPSEAEELGRRIVADLARPIEVEGNHVRSSASVGLTLADRSTTPDELLRQADVALYRAKALGRSCLATYSVDEDRWLDAELDLEPELRRAVDRDEFTLHYQPIIDLQTGQVVSVEALLRWEHPGRGLLTPDAFLAHAISSGLLGTIGESSLRRACTDFASIDPTDVGHSLPSVAVNLSSSELADRRVVARVAAALADSGLAPRRLTLEITEDVIIDESVRATIDELRALGVHLAIDDFGTGNSSLRQLGSYPAAVLKVDKSFVDRIEVDGSARAITAAIIRMSRDLGLTTVAEGVETSEQAELLAGMGCDRVQGWLISKALPFEELMGWCVTNCPIGPYRDSRESVSSASSMMRASSSATGGRSSIAPTT